MIPKYVWATASVRWTNELPLVKEFLFQVLDSYQTVNLSKQMNEGVSF